ncbi:MAG: phenylalanine--tRNA ligase subunit beta [Actinomycetaceae bacterium]|nr:phenylalanine--tRNA ligase subunit beta [Actinomycetaceae bacterium]
MPNIPIDWLKDHVEVPAGFSAKDLSAALLKVGFEEETIHSSGMQGPLVCGQVLTISPEEQSNGKTINYCRVDVGAFNDAPGTGKEPSDLPSRSIVCGAHNFKVGDHVVVVLPGAVLPGDFAISARKTYGHISDGMICSLRELGLGQDHDGIIVLEDYLQGDVPAVGTDMIPILGLGEELLEINVTPDRGYCFSMRGLAREFSHSTGAAFTDRGLASSMPSGQVDAPTDDGFVIEVEDSSPIRGRVGCDRFATRIVTGIDPSATTPPWMVKRLEQLGMRSISLPVDVTNYVMMDVGQPMHAYDLDTLVGPIVVRRAKSGEKLQTLDGQERLLDPQDLLITDCKGGHAARIVGMAGVMGGLETEVTQKTTTILLEAAHFDPVSIARTARRHKLPSEASKRFERGVDPQLAPVAAQRAAELLVEYGSARIVDRVGDYNKTSEMPVIVMPLSEVPRLTGHDWGDEYTVQALEMIGCQVSATDGVLQVRPPSWRPDLTLGADLVEEVARLGGYDEVPSVLPVPPAGRGLPATIKARRDIARSLAEAGLTQVLSYPFIGNSHDRMGLPADSEFRNAVRLANPLAEDAPLLRTRILDSLLLTAERNVSRGMTNLAIYEIAMVASSIGVQISPIPSAEAKPSSEELKALRLGTPKQPWHVGVVLAGDAQLAGPLSSKQAWDWADALEIVYRLASLLGVELRVETADTAPWHPGRCAAFYTGTGRGGRFIAHAGELHPKVCKAFGLPARACAIELDLDALIRSTPKTVVQVKKVSTMPVVKEDFAFVVDQEVSSARVTAAIAKAGKDMIEDIRLFDIYEGEQVGQGRKSLAFSVRLRAEDHTMNTEEINKIRKTIIEVVGKTCDATLRS